nr:MAG TPA: hypothetical protein [Caudoviricetes sp.]
MIFSFDDNLLIIISLYPAQFDMCGLLTKQSFSESGINIPLFSVLYISLRISIN